MMTITMIMTMMITVRTTPKPTATPKYECSSAVPPSIVVSSASTMEQCSEIVTAGTLYTDDRTLESKLPSLNNCYILDEWIGVQRNS